MLSHSPSIVTDGLVLCLDAANLKSYSGTGITWTNVGPTNINVSLVNGPSFVSSNNGYFNFDGTNDYANLETSIASAISPNIPCSFNVWVRFSSTSKDQTIFATPNKTGGVPFILFFDSVVFSRNNTNVGDIGGGTTNALVVLIGDASPASDLRYSTANNIVTSNTWYNICVVLDPPNDKFWTYLNGSVVALFNSSACQGIRSHTDNFIIGETGGDPLNGNIAQVSIYNRALNIDEIKQNFNALRGRFGI